MGLDLVQTTTLDELKIALLMFATHLTLLFRLFPHRNPSLTNFAEPVEELTIVGYADEPEVDMLFETGRVFYVHQQCAIWSSHIHDLTGELVSPFVVQASSRRCAYCSHYGAGISCKVTTNNQYLVYSFFFFF